MPSRHEQEGTIPRRGALAREGSGEAAGGETLVRHQRAGPQAPGLENVRIFNGTKGRPRSFDRSTAARSAGVRLAHWRVSSEEIKLPSVSSTSIPSPRCGWKTPRSSSRHTGAACAFWQKEDSTGSASINPTGSPIPAAILGLAAGRAHPHAAALAGRKGGGSPWDELEPAVRHELACQEKGPPPRTPRCTWSPSKIPGAHRDPFREPGRSPATTGLRLSSTP